MNFELSMNFCSLGSLFQHTHAEGPKNGLKLKWSAWLPIWTFLHPQIPAGPNHSLLQWPTDLCETLVFFFLKSQKQMSTNVDGKLCAVRVFLQNSQSQKRNCRINKWRFSAPFARRCSRVSEKNGSKPDQWLVSLGAWRKGLFLVHSRSVLVCVKTHENRDKSQ